MTDIKQICARLIELWDADCDINVEINELRAALAEPEPEGPTIGEVVELVAWLLEGGEDAAANGWDHQARQFARAAELLQLQHPQP